MTGQAAIPRDIARDLSRTFEAARWAESNGQPVCPTCYDGADLTVCTQATRHQALRGDLPVYYCTCCRRYISPITGTPLTRSELPLVYWAYFVAGGIHPLHELSREWGVGREALRRIKKRVAEPHPMTSRWRNELMLNDCTPDLLFEKGRTMRGTS